MKTAVLTPVSQWRFQRFDFAKLQQSRGYDMLMRLPLLAWCAFCAVVQMAALAGYVREAGPALSYAVLWVNVAMRASTIAFLLLMAAAVVLRARPTGRAPGIEPRISAFIGAFLVYTIPFCPRAELSVAGEIASTVMVLGGSTAAVYTLLQLGRSFSMMAE